MRASPASATRTLWMTERSATIVATPSATHAKKNSSRRHDARISAHGHQQGGLSASCVTSTSVQPRRWFTSTSQVDDLVAGHTVEVPRGFIGQQDRRIVRERARNRHPLLFAA